jgi:hypothetical protein
MLMVHLPMALLSDTNNYCVDECEVKKGEWVITHTVGRLL